MLKSLSRTNVNRIQHLLITSINTTPYLSLQLQFFSIHANDQLNPVNPSIDNGTDDKQEQESVSSTFTSKVGIVSHPSCLFHEINDHPETPNRLKTVLECLNNPEITSIIDKENNFSDNLSFIDNPTQITRSRLTIAHSQTHVDQILDKAEEAQEQNKIIELDPDTFLSPHSAQSIMYAPACVSYAVEMVLNDKDDYEYKVYTNTR